MFDVFLAVGDAWDVKERSVVFWRQWKDVFPADGVDGVLFAVWELHGVDRTDDSVCCTVAQFGEVVDCDAKVEVRFCSVCDLLFLDECEVVVGDIDGPEVVDGFVNDCVAVEREYTVVIGEQVAEGCAHEHHVGPAGGVVWAGGWEERLVADVHGRDAWREIFREGVVLGEEDDVVCPVMVEEGLGADDHVVVKIAGSGVECGT